MKVLVVSDVLGEENNGTTIAAMNLIRYLREQGDDVRILCGDKNRKGEKNTFVVPELHLGLIANYIIKKNNVTISRPKTKVIKQALKGVDIVHSILPFAVGKKTVKLAKKMGIPVTSGFHCQAENFSAHIFNTMNWKWYNDHIYKRQYKKYYSKVNAIHYPTQFIRNVFETTIKRKTNGYVISNGVNSMYKKQIVERDSKLNKKFNILFIGRISKEKTHPILLKAVSLSKYKDNIQLIFAGKGPQEKLIHKLENKYDLNPVMMDFYSRTELIKIINSSDLYVHPSEIEIEAISCLEAISCGLVPIISDSKRSATNAFALDEKNLFKHDSAEDLARKIDYWIEHPEEKEEYSKRYENYTRQFAQDNCMKKMRDMLLTYAKDDNHTNKKIFYYKDELNDDFALNGVEAKKISSKFKYLHKNPIYKFFEFILYHIIVKPLIKIINKIHFRQKFVNHLTAPKRKLKGCFIYSNHTQSSGDAFTPNLIFHRKNNIIVGPEAFSIPCLKTIVSMLGGLPLPSTFEGTLKFTEAIKRLSNKGQHITIYPEAHIWPYYTDIRPFSDGSFRYPVDNNKPVICITNTYEQKRGRVRMVSHIEGPFYPDLSLDKKEARKKLRNQIYETMKNRANSVTQFEKIKYINLKTIEQN